MALDVDVLIIGAGGAGCRAAIAAADCGASVLMVSKAAPGRAGVLLDKFRGHDIMLIVWENLNFRVFPKQLFWTTPGGVKAIRTAGSTADWRFSALLIELKAQIL